MLLFADTIIEHKTTYRFLIQGAANILGVQQTCADYAMFLPPLKETERRKVAINSLFKTACAEIPGLIRIADGRTPFEVYRDKRMIGNSTTDPCSLHLKRELIDHWTAFYAPDAVNIVGLDWTEVDRFERYARKVGRASAPMMESPLMSKKDMLEWAEREGLTISDAYKNGLSHDNCSGLCCKAGQGHWAHVHRVRPAEFAYGESEENACRDIVGDYSMLSDRGDGKKKTPPADDVSRLARGWKSRR